MVLATAGSPYSTVLPLVNPNEIVSWVPQEDKERLASYFKYDDIYWSVPGTFKLEQRGDDSAPIYIPNARTIVDTTAYYLLKGLKISVADPDKHKDQAEALENLLVQEKFYSTFHTAKHAGVARGDFILHITADPEAPEGKRISFNSVLPHMYFPVYDPDPAADGDEVVEVYLAEEYTDPITSSVYVKRLHYFYADEVRADGTKVVMAEEGLYEVQNWSDAGKAKLFKELLPAEQLLDPVDRIPVYHFTNQHWDCELFGSSELRGFETLMASVNQSVSDEELALALEGLGVYATDAQGPIDDDGNDLPWEIAPARVMEVPTGSFFKRVEGVGSVKPMQDHIGYLDTKIMQGSGTSEVALGNIDVQTADSGIALAIKFMPTQAKLEERDIAGVEMLKLMFMDWQLWHQAYEDSTLEAVEIVVTLGDKLPTNRTAVLNELNNMHDRNVISSAFYRSEMERQLGYNFPEDMQTQIINEVTALAAAKVTAPTPDTGNLEGADPAAPASEPADVPTGGGDPLVTKKGSTVPKGSKSNNASHPNESGGTEA